MCLITSRRGSLGVGEGDERRVKSDRRLGAAIGSEQPKAVARYKDRGTGRAQDRGLVGR